MQDETRLYVDEIYHLMGESMDLFDAGALIAAKCSDCLTPFLSLSHSLSIQFVPLNLILFGRMFVLRLLRLPERRAIMAASFPSPLIIHVGYVSYRRALQAHIIVHRNN